MKKSAYIIAAAAGVLLAAYRCGAETEQQRQIILSGGSNALAEIVVPDAPTHCENYAAGFLKKYLDKASGANFAITRESAAGKGKPAIYVGATNRAKAALPNFDPETADYDTAVLKTCGGDIVVGGHKKRGTLYAAAMFLEENIGVRFWADDGICVPQNGKIAVGEIDKISAPAFQLRKVDYKVGQNFELAAALKSSILPSTNPELRREIDECFAVSYHSAYKIIPPKKYFNEHPEWFAKIGGKRVFEHAQLCFTNDEMAAEFARNVLAALEKRPYARYVHVSQNDWNGWCECAKCAAFEKAHGDAHSAPILAFANKIAQAVEKKYPDVKVVTFAYTYSRKPPEGIVPRKNVWIELCSIECDFAHPLETDTEYGFTKDFVEWGKITDRITIWDYTTCFKNYQIPYPNFGVLAKNIGFFKKNGAIGLFEQSDQTNTAGDFVRLRNWYLYKLMWNPALDASALLDEFLRGYYAPEVAPLLREYLDAQTAAAERTNFALSCYYTDTLTWMDCGTFGKMRSAMKRALAKARRLEKAAPEKYRGLTDKIRRESLPIDYVAVLNYAQLYAAAKRTGTSVKLPKNVESLAKSITERWLKFGTARINQHETRRQFEEFAAELPQIAKRQSEYVAAKPDLSPSPDLEKFGERGSVAEIQEAEIDQCNFARNVMSRPVVYVKDPAASNGWAAKLDANCERMRRFEINLRDTLVKLKSPSGKTGLRKFKVYAFVRGLERQPPNAELIAYTFKKGTWNIYMKHAQKYDVFGEDYKPLYCGEIELDASRKDAASFLLWLRLEGVKNFDDILLDRVVIAAQ